MKDWKGVVRAVAPALATALGGPMAGVAVREIGGKLLGKPDAGEEAVAAAITGATPDTLLRLKELDQAFAKQMAELGVELEKIDAGDRASARAREIATHDWTPRVLAGVMVVGFFCVTGFIFTHQMPKEMNELAFMTLGTLNALLVTVFTYYFGSSHGSRGKDEVIGRAVGR